MRTTTLLTFAILFLFSSAPARAVVLSGAMDNRSGFPFIPGFTGQSMVWTTGGHASAGLRLEWRADNETTPGFWTYTYRVLRGSAQNKGFAFFDLETASDLTAADIQDFRVKSATDRNGAYLSKTEILNCGYPGKDKPPRNGAKPGSPPPLSGR